MASLRLRTEPTVHQVEVILARVERELAECGARVKRGARGELRFRMPPPWRARGAKLLRLVSAGEINVSAGGVHLNGVFANCLTNATITNMNWEIRQGISEGNGGTLVASGSGSVTMTATGRNGFGFDEFNLLVKGLDVSLDEGTYFLGTNVGDLGGARSFVSTTVGTNSVGSPGGNNGNTFLNSTFFGANFTDWQNLVGPGTWDVSYGVQTDSVPEPATFVAIGLGLAALVARRRK